MKKERSSLSAPPVALVTGGARRLGRHIAIRLAREGFRVAVTYNLSSPQRVLQEIEMMGSSHYAVKVNNRNTARIAAAVGDIASHFGRIDVLVNNAGLFFDAQWDAFDEDAWDALLQTNLKGPTFYMQAVAKVMLAQRKGKIINIASLGGLQPWSRHIPYSVSKAGLIMSTRCFARALAPHVTVNAIAPGTIIMKDEEDPDVKHIPLKKIPLQRYGSPEDITDLAVFLATKGDYITGQVITVDGGRSIVPVGE